MKKLISLLLLIIPLIAQAQGDIDWPPHPDSIRVENNAGGFLRYLWPPTLREGANITFGGTDDTLIISGPAAAGTADSVGVDSNGDGVIDAYLYSLAGAAHCIKKGSNITLTTLGDTLTIASLGGAGESDTIWIYNSVGNDSLASSAGPIRLKWSTGITGTINGRIITASVDKSGLALSFGDISGSIADAQVPNNITINYADSANAVTTEGIEDKIGAMVSSNTETGITVTYNDAGGKINFVVSGLDSSFINLASIPFSRWTQNGAAIGQVPKWTGSMWQVANDNSTGSPGEQTLGKNEIDTTLSNIPFNDAYRVTTNAAESLLATVRCVRVIAHDSLANYSLSGHTHSGSSLVDQSIAKADLDSITSNYAFHGAFHGTSATAESSFTTFDAVRKINHDSLGAAISRLGQTIESAEITNATIAPIDIDTTATWKFLHAFKATSAVADSEFATLNFSKKIAGDTTAAHYVKADTNGYLAAGNVVTMSHVIWQEGYLMEISIHGNDTLYVGVDSTKLLTMANVKDTLALVIEDSLDQYHNITAEGQAINDSLDVLVNRHIGTDSLAESMINWNYEWWPLSVIHGWDRPTEDSVYIPMPPHGAGDSWALTDSSGNISVGDKDTIFASLSFPYPCTIDSLIVGYKCASAADSIIDVAFYGPDLSSYTNTTDSLYWTSSTNLNATSWTEVGYTFSNDVSTSARYRYAIRIITYFSADNRAIYFNGIWLRIRR